MKKLQNYNKNNFEREKQKQKSKLELWNYIFESILMKAIRNIKLQNGRNIKRTGDMKHALFRSLLARPFRSVPINRCKLIMQSSRTTLWLIYERMYAAFKNMNTGNFSMTTKHKYLSPHL